MAQPTIGLLFGQRRSMSQEKKIIATSLVTTSGHPIEMVYDEEAKVTKYVELEGDEIKEHFEGYDDGGQASYSPIKPTSNILKNHLIVFPSRADEYESEESLVSEVREFIHEWVDLTPEFESISAHYVLFTWVYDNFNELPYLRVIGDYGSGKSRFLQTIGSVCYKPIFASGAATVSPIFRLIDEHNGTLILDEADFSASDTYSDIVKILNCGTSKWAPVIRSEGSSDKQFEPRAFNVFGPKVLATRNYFQDTALESRLIVEVMGSKKLRTGIPRNLNKNFYQKALSIRNKLLMFRLRNYGKTELKINLTDESLEPRINQMLIPIASVIADQSLVEDLKTRLVEYHKDKCLDRGSELEGIVLEAVHSLYQKNVLAPTVGQIKAEIFELYADENRYQLTARKIGEVLRKNLKISTKRTRDGYAVETSSRDFIDRLLVRYGIVNEVNNVNVPGDGGNKLVSQMSLEEIEEIFNK